MTLFEFIKKFVDNNMITFKKLGGYGGFGNQLFQYVGTRLYAHLNNFRWAFPNWIGDDIFFGTKPYSLFNNIQVKFLPTFCIPIDNSQPLNNLYQNPKDNINIHGYLQDKFSLELLKKNKNIILEWLTFEDIIEKPLADLTLKYRPWLGIHIRRKDFPKQKWLPIQYYQDTLKKIRSNHNIILCSDDENIASNFNYPNIITIKNTFSHIPNHIFDFWLLKNAEIIIGSGSTFSWWAAYLNKKNHYYSPPLSHLWENAKQVTIQKTHD